MKLRVVFTDLGMMGACRLQQAYGLVIIGPRCPFHWSAAGDATSTFVSRYDWK